MVKELSGGIRSLMEQAVALQPGSVQRDPDIPAGDFEDRPQSGPNPLPDGQYYYVKPDDWLSKIAAEFYGDPMKYPILFEANNDPERAKERGTDLVTDPDVIEKGWRLFHPRAARALTGPCFSTAPSGSRVARGTCRARGTAITDSRSPNVVQ